VRTLSQLFIVQCSMAVDAVRSRDNLDDRTPDRTPFARSGARPQQPSLFHIDSMQICS
jgi:hypothetical protein